MITIIIYFVENKSDGSFTVPGIVNASKPKHEDRADENLNCNECYDDGYDYKTNTLYRILKETWVGTID